MANTTKRGEMRIGLLGAGMIGETLGRLWVRSGHAILLSSRHPESLADLARSMGASARTGTIEEAAEFGEALLLAVPFGAVTTIGPAVARAAARKLVLDAGNPFPHRDGAAAVEARAGVGGSGVWVARHFPLALVVKAFNTVHYRTLAREAHRAGERVGVPIAGDDAGALETTERLVRDAGFDPVIVGPLSRSAEFDPGTAVWNTGMTGPEVRRLLVVEGERG